LMPSRLGRTPCFRSSCSLGTVRPTGRQGLGCSLAVAVGRRGRPRLGPLIRATLRSGAQFPAQTTLGSAADAVYASHDAAWPCRQGGHLAAAGLAAWEVTAVSVVTEHLQQRGSAFEVLLHRQAYTSTEKAGALGIGSDEVLKTLAVRTGPGYALVVIPASRRLDLHLVRDALGDNHARLASEEELGRDFAGYQLGALPPLGALLGSELYVDPEVLGHDTVAFAAGSQTESIRMRTEELFGGQQVTTAPLVRQADRGGEDPVGRRRAAQQDVAGGHPAP
jgi:Ala-tRNA(Pro) deacylase